MNEPDNDESKGFKVTDRRKFTSEGEPRGKSDDETDAESPPDSRSSPETASPASSGRPAASPPASRHSAGHSPGETSSAATFVDLVGMLATNAMLQLGDVPNPASGERVENLQAVQDMISFLEILDQKTKGNLSQKEGEVLEQVLYDLRMRYMAKAKILDL